MAYIVDDIINYFANKEANDRAAALLDKRNEEIDKIGMPNFGSGQYDFQDYQTPDEARLQQINVDPATRNLQLEAMQKLRSQLETTGNAEDEARRYRAMQDANNMARSRSEAVIADANARGQGGTGLEFALRAQAAQEGANRAQAGSLESAAQAARDRLQGLSAYNSMLSGVRNQDTDLAAQNAGIANNATMYNIGQRNNRATMNVQGRNDASRYNLDRGDRNKMNTFGANMQKQGLKGQLTQNQLANIDAQGKLPGQLVGGLMNSGANIAMTAAGGAGAFGDPKQLMGNAWAKKQMDRWG